MDVLQHDPLPFLVALIKLFLRNTVLPLPQGDGVQLFDGINATLLG